MGNPRLKLKYTIEKIFFKKDLRNMENQNKSELSRRHFVQGLGVSAAALGVFSMTQSLSADGLPRDANGNVIPGFGEDEVRNLFNS